MESRPKISIGMIARNAEKYVEDTIRSVLAQRDPSWELLIRNNGSTDRTGEICERHTRYSIREGVERATRILSDTRLATQLEPGIVDYNC